MSRSTGRGSRRYLTVIRHLELDRKGPLTARSVLASALLGESPPTLTVRQLVHVAALFGINENRARVALSRMAARGEVSTQGDGTYSLTGRLLERADRQAASRAGRTNPFDGNWHVVIVTTAGDAALVRHDRRERLEAARLGEVRDGVWMRPANIELQLGDVPALLVLRSVPDADPASLAASIFDVEGWRRRASTLIEQMDATPLERTSDLAAGFVRDAEVLRHLQHDPLLPEELCGEHWPGPHLRARYEEFDAAFRVLLAASHHDAAPGVEAP